MRKENRIPVLLMLIVSIGTLTPTTKIEQVLKLPGVNLTAMVAPPVAFAFSPRTASASLVLSKTTKTTSAVVVNKIVAPAKTKASPVVVPSKKTAPAKTKASPVVVPSKKTTVVKAKVAKGKVSRSNVVSRSSPPIKIVSFEVSAYSPTSEECDGDPFTTASGKRVYVGGIAADLSRYPLGTIMIVQNYNNGNPCTVVDSGSAIKGNKLDVFFWHTIEAINWGRRKNVQVKILYLAPK